MMIFGERLKYLREDKGITQIDLANFLMLANSTISQYESGKRTPDVETLQKIADFFGTTTDYLLGKTNNRNLNDDETPEEIAEIFDFIRDNSKR